LDVRFLAKESHYLLAVQNQKSERATMKMIDNEIRKVSKIIGRCYGEIELSRITGDKQMVLFWQKRIKERRQDLKNLLAINRNPNGGRASLNGHTYKPGGLGVDRAPVKAVDCRTLDLAK
jgi:hypothetical protein